MVRVGFHIYFKSMKRKILHTDSHDKMGYSTKLRDSIFNRISSVFPTSGICITVIVMYFFDNM
jgi:hypothetical protein